MNHWLEFVRGRCNELHWFVFNQETERLFDPETVRVNRMAYRAYHKELNRLGYGRDEDDLPQLQWYSLL